MNVPKNIIVICEGASEATYLQRLNSFLANQPYPDEWYDVPIRFVIKPSKEGVGTGAYKRVEQALRKEIKANPTFEKWVWVDADLYVRNDKGARDGYLKRPQTIPSFFFSVLNFEDFLALHLDDDKFAAWIQIMSSAGHFRTPLHSDDYETLFKQILPHYRKAELPVDFITLESLGNLKRHLSQMPTIDNHGLPIDRTFAAAIVAEINHWYPLPT